MATIQIVTTKEEQDIMLAVIAKHKNDVIAVTALAKEADINPNRARFIIQDLEAAGKIARIPMKAFNVHYIRYKYEVLLSK